nr:MAG: replication associated protein [Arizlama virus]
MAAAKIVRSFAIEQEPLEIASVEESAILEAQEKEMAELQKKKSVPRVRNVCFTLNNYTPEELQFLQGAFEKSDHMKYLVFQQESGEETKTPHIQGYVEFSGSIAYSTVKYELTGDKKSRIHLELRRGTSLQASVYCKKSETRIPNVTPFEYGKLSRSGARTDIEAVVDCIKESGSKEAAIQYPVEYIRMNKGMEKLDAVYKENVPKPVPKVFWFYGATGCGKTAYAEKMFPNSWHSKKTLEWFDGYDGQENVIIDDFRGNFCPFSELLRILDRYKLSLPVKGGFTNWIPKNIIITSCFAPQDAYRDRTDENIQQLMRRIHVIRHYYKPFTHIVLKDVPVCEGDLPEDRESTMEEYIRSLSPKSRQRLLFPEQKSIEVKQDEDGKSELHIRVHDSSILNEPQRILSSRPLPALPPRPAPKPIARTETPKISE